MNRQQLDDLTTKQDFLRPEQLSEEEEQDLLERTEEERNEFSDTPTLQEDDIPSLERVEPSDTLYIAQTVQHPYITTKMKSVLDEIIERMERKESDGIAIVVSLTRIGEAQLEANPKIAETGTHPKGEAVDFAGKFMKKHFPDSAAALRSVLEAMHAEDKIHFIDEEASTAFWHVSRCQKD